MTYAYPMHFISYAEVGRRVDGGLLVLLMEVESGEREVEENAARGVPSTWSPSSFVQLHELYA